MAIMRYIWLVLLAGCATIPSELAGKHFAAITPRTAEHSAGSSVRWGGTIASVSSKQAETCFEVVSRPLDASARPEEGDRTEGRFIACAAGFFDPVVYASGREVTFVGTLQAPSLGKIGGYEYLFPRLAASTVHLWPKRQPVQYYDPAWYPPWMMGVW